MPDVGVLAGQPERVYVDGEKYDQFKQECSEYLVIDSGATNNLEGANTSDDMQDNLADNGVDPTFHMKLDTQDTKEFRFGNDKTGQAAGLRTFDTSLLGKDVAYRTYLCDGGAPWLGSYRVPV